MQGLTGRLRWRGFKWRAMALLVIGRRQAAMRALRVMLAEFPGDAYALASIANLHAQSGDTQSALATTAQLLALHPDDGAHWFNSSFRWKPASATPKPKPRSAARSNCVHGARPRLVRPGSVPDPAGSPR